MTLLITDGNPRGLGYLEIRHADPVSGAPTVFEADTYTCSHCNAVVVLNPARTRERYKCRGCNHHICDSCAAERVAGAACKTMAQKFDEHLDDVARRGPDGDASLIIRP